MDYKRVLTIQDISCVGQCSTSVALPILSACGIETCAFPSAILSAHTGGFRDLAVCSMTPHFPEFIHSWQTNGIHFDAIYTGYLASSEQIFYIEKIADSLLKEDGLLIVDPAMADNGTLYTGFDASHAAAMGRLCERADILLPNWTEACLLSGQEHITHYTKKELEMVLKKLGEKPDGYRSVILTSASTQQGETGVAILHEGKVSYYTHRRIPGNFCGTGDIFSSAFTGLLLNGFDLLRSACEAADFTLSCIEEGTKFPEHWYGVPFELCLPHLISILQGK